MLTEASSPWQSTPQLLSHYVWMTRLTKTRFQGLSRIGGKQGDRAVTEQESTVLVLQEGGPLPGPETGLLSNTPK